MGVGAEREGKAIASADEREQICDKASAARNATQFLAKGQSCPMGGVFERISYNYH